MMNLESVDQIKFASGDAKIDLDIYYLEKRSPLSTKEYTIRVDFLNEKISGDCIAHRSWFDLEKEECLEILELMLIDNQPKRDFSHII